jgi:aspartyl-tRNA(Asn)/glutamyl-tRNA(Gln) amidotransferase subunit A
MSGPDPADESCVGRRFAWAGADRTARRYRVAVPKGSTDRVQPEVRENFDKALASLGPRVEVTRDVEWPDLPWGPSVSAIVSAEGAAAFLPLIESGDTVKLRCPADRTGAYSSLALPAVDYINALRARRPMKRAMAKLFERFDVIATPTRATVAYPVDTEFQNAYPGVNGGPAVIPAGNLAGLPAIALPNGFGENGLPTSIAFMGAAFSERTLVTLAHLYQTNTDWHRRRPPLA